MRRFLQNTGWKRLLVALASLLCAGVLGLGLVVRSTVKRVPRLFKRNGELKAQGYYMGEFEFKMLATQFYLNEGRYLEAYRTLARITEELRSTRGLARMPEHATPETQMAFLLDRQDPATGAFMDARYPLFTYFAPTCNVVEALQRLSRETGRPLKLKYPMRFLDQYQTPEQLRAYLDSVLYLDETSARLPGPGPYGPGASELAGFDVLEEAGLHRFPEAWKTELRRWFYDTQDPATGFWGARIGRPGRWRQRTDINTTFHILKLVVDEWGNNRSSQFPLRYGGTLARGVLAEVGRPIPADEAEQHDWGLKQCQGAKILARLLWPHLSEADRQEVRRRFRDMLAQSYRLYRPQEGGFAYYLSDTKADVDGTGLATSVLELMGGLPGTRDRERLWGTASERTLVPAVQVVSVWQQAKLPGSEGVESYRVYRDRLPVEPCDGADLLQIVYADGAKGLDLMDLRQGLARFLGAGGATFGNWTAKQGLRDLPLALDREVKAVPVTRGTFDLGRIARTHPARRYYLVGYDIVQLPVVAVVVEQR